MPNDVIAAELKLRGQAQFSAGAKKAGKDVEGIGKSAEETGKTTQKSSKATALGMLKTAAAAGATYKGFQYLKGSVQQTIDLAKSTSALARVSGLDKKQAQAWTVVAKQRGIETSSLQMGMATLGRSLGGLGGPTKTTDVALQKLGLTSAQLMALPMDLRMGMIADSFKAMPDGVDKAALSQKLFGRAGKQLLPLLNSGSQALNEQLNTANKLVPPLGNSGKAALKLAADQRKLKMSTMGIQVAMGTALLPVITQLTAIIQPLIAGAAGLMTKFKPLSYVVIALGVALVGLLVMDKIRMAMQALKVATIAKTIADKAAWVATKAWTAAQWLFNAAMTANPIMLVVAGIAALIAIIVLAYIKVGWFRTAVQAMGGAVVAAFNWVVRAAKTAFGWIKSNWPLLLGILSGPFGLAVVLIIKHFDKIKTAASSVFNSVKSIFGKIPGVIKSIFSGAGNFAGNVGREIADWLNANTPFGDEIKVGPAHFRLPALAEGGIMRMGGPAIVGERGPEIVSLPAGAAVMPLPTVGTMATTVQVPVYLERRQIALAVGEFYSDQAARKGTKVAR